MYESCFAELWNLVISHPFVSFLVLFFAGHIVTAWFENHPAWFISLVLWTASIVCLGIGLGHSVNFMRYASWETRAIQQVQGQEFMERSGLLEFRKALEGNNISFLVKE